MATPRIVDPNKLLLLGAVTDWLATYRRHIQRAPDPRDIAARRQLGNTRIVQLRWLIAGTLGYPSAPFEVWRRPAMPFPNESPIECGAYTSAGRTLLHLSQPRVFVRLTVQAPSGGSVIAYGGAPYASAVVAMQALANGAQSVALCGPAIQSIVLLGTGLTVQSITGVDGSVANDADWKRVEIVGLPSDASWAGVAGLDAKQGLVAALTSPGDAALDRFRRGAPFYGWDETITAGMPAPPWVLADPRAMLDTFQANFLDPLRTMITTLAPRDHASYEVDHTLPPLDPINPAAGANAAVARFRPLSTLVFGASTDPLASLITGFGTALEDEDLPPMTLRDRQYFNDSTHSDWDFMVIARYGQGLDGQTDPVEYAAMVFSPGVGLPPPVPAGLQARLDGLSAPRVVDGDWRGVARVSWDKIDDGLPFRAGSYGFARAATAPAGPVGALMTPRPKDPQALQPIGATASAEQTASGRLQALDERYALASTPNPNVLRYGVAHQDLFGLWSAWSTTSLSLGEPPVRKVDLLRGALDTQNAAGLCPATLTIEFAWDWATRSPARIEFVARLYAQARYGDGPADITVPPGLQTRLGVPAGVPFAVVFDGNPAPSLGSGAAGVAGAIEPLSQDGNTAQNGPATNAGPRRYRLTITGLSLDFNATGRIGIAVWARATEFRLPRRVGAWSDAPLVASAADPRPPVVTIEHEDVLMASMADASGEHHAHLEWPPAPGAIGYFVYTTTETKLRSARGLAPVPRSITLSERLVALRDAFAADPSRGAFTRIDAQPFADTRKAVTLPRGSREIHLFVVLAVSAGQVESAWPALGDAGLRKRPIAYAAPQTVAPSPPDLEVSCVRDDSVVPAAYRAQIRMRNPSGARVVRVDLHRVRVAQAAAQLDTMGPAVARIDGSNASYQATPVKSATPGESQPLAMIIGRDDVSGSWKRVYYRAVAWAGHDPARGLYGTRSAPSSLREVIVPPATPPDLSTPVWHWPGDALEDVVIDALTRAPVEPTPLGPHRVRVELYEIASDGRLAPMVSFPEQPGADALDAVPEAPPVGANHGVWRAPGAAAGQTELHVRVRRTGTERALCGRILLTDPIGRATEQAIDVPAGSPLPAPDLLNPDVVKIVGRGYAVSFETTAPITMTAAGPYMLTVRFTPIPLLPISLPGGPRPVLGASVTRALPDISPTRPNDNLQTDPDTIPLRRSPGSPGTPAHTRVSASIRSQQGGTVLVTLAAPDGRVTSFSRTLS
ncbi:hypothetical protein [Paraburkholderia sp. J10-1]|uniref:hypothetical protein n=1 Tax=Paraburkholderia sp. J10-1 TaxID=2805430 RepID=UPI002AB72B47|nr:hypothetical protein [Paraburkholderia sp. J10-1]